MGLLPGQCTEDLGFHFFREVGDDGGVCFKASQDKRACQPLESRQAVSRSPSALDGVEKEFLEGLPVPKESRIQEIHDSPEVPYVIFYRRPGQGHTEMCIQVSCGPRLFCFRILYVLGLIQDDSGPLIPVAGFFRSL